jgi:serine/threonine-protein kinase HipA
MKRLFVWVRRPDGRISLAGELATSEPQSGNGRFESEFEYAPEWLADKEAYALDPVSLPLGQTLQRWRAEQLDPPLAAFDDALPDDWGRRLLAAAIKLDGVKPSPPEMLLRMRGAGTGALIFTADPIAPLPEETVQTTALPALLSAAARYEAGTLPPDAQFRKLLAGSSRAGGARPKALVHDAAGEWIAKFPSRARDELHDVVGLEATCLELARRAGLEVPASRLQIVGRRRVLLVRRFDVTARNGRIHMVSMRTLCKERPGVYVQSYSELMQVLRKYSAAPAADVVALFRHMAFNAAIGNVDDHLKNFWMLATPAGWRLAPAFDLVPDTAGRGEHTLSFQYAFACPDRAQLEALARLWNVSNPGTEIDRIVTAVSKFATFARKLAVRGDKRLEHITADIRRRVKLLR